jgi:hypothetical protein
LVAAPSAAADVLGWWQAAVPDAAEPSADHD